MLDKLIRAIEWFETDDGYRVEIKGDKEAIKAALEEGRPIGPGYGRGPLGLGLRLGRRFGFGGRGRGWGAGFGRGYGAGYGPGSGVGFGPPAGWTPWWAQQPSEDKPEEK